MPHVVCDCAKSGQADASCAKTWEKQMQDGFAAESLRRQEGYKNMEETMTAKMEEAFRSEQQARTAGSK